MKFGQNPIGGLGGDVIGRNCLRTDERTDAWTDGHTHDGRRTKCDHKSSYCHYVTGELKKNAFLHQCKKIKLSSQSRKKNIVTSPGQGIY